jgi:hypothetical protein
MHCAQIGLSLSSSDTGAAFRQHCLASARRIDLVEFPIRKTREQEFLVWQGLSPPLHSTLYSDLGSCTTTQLCTTDGIRARELSKSVDGGPR